MNRILIGTSAIALAAATPAPAVEWDVGVGGFMNLHLGYASSDVNNAPGADVDGVDVLNDSEIIFRPRITLDNGLEIGGQVQLEAQSDDDQIDESFVFIDGSFGEINIGDENSAGFAMTFAAPNVTALAINSGSQSAFIPFSGADGTNLPVTGLTNFSRNPRASSFVEVGRNNDAARITYYSPRFFGFQIGASYARDGNQDDNTQVDLNGARLGDIWDVGANYVNAFGGIDVALSGRYGAATDDRTPTTAVNNLGGVVRTDIGDNPEVFAFGANIGFAGFTLGYAFAETNSDDVRDAQGHSAGLSYETGPWGVSFTYYRGEGVDEENPFAVTPTGASANDEVYQSFHAGVAYTIASGVTLSVYGNYTEVDEDTSDDGSPGGDDIDGFIIGSAVALDF